MTAQKTYAIEAAIAGDWERVIIINQGILEEDAHDIETINRLAFAYTILGKTQQAKKLYQQVLEIDPCNPIAQKNIKRLAGSASLHTKGNGYHINNNLFLEESGKTKVVTLLNAAQPKILRTLQIGQSLDLHIKRLKIFALVDKQFIGMLPDDVSKRLIRFMKGGNTYEAHTKSIEEKTVSIFIRETKRIARFKNQPSFPALGHEKTNLNLPKKKVYKEEDSDDAE